MSRLVLPVTVALLAAFALSSPSADARPGIIKGATCKACHQAMPPKKANLSPKAATMAKKFKLTECKNCHGAQAGKLVLLEPATGSAPKK